VCITIDNMLMVQCKSYLITLGIKMVPIEQANDRLITVDQCKKITSVATVMLAEDLVM